VTLDDALPRRTPSPPSTDTSNMVERVYSFPSRSTVQKIATEIRKEPVKKVFNNKTKKITKSHKDKSLKSKRKEVNASVIGEKKNVKLDDKLNSVLTKGQHSLIRNDERKNKPSVRRLISSLEKENNRLPLTPDQSPSIEATIKEEINKIISHTKMANRQQLADFKKPKKQQYKLGSHKTNNGSEIKSTVIIKPKKSSMQSISPQINTPQIIDVKSKENRDSVKSQKVLPVQIEIHRETHASVGLTPATSSSLPAGIPLPLRQSSPTTGLKIPMLNYKKNLLLRKKFMKKVLEFNKMV
ncbi:unnamed protein product, partial [Didymodactylos carnosus]